MEKKEICHVCKREKKPYIVFLNNSIFSLINHDQAREKGPICERCDRYFAMTMEFKDATEEEFEIAKKASHFANTMQKWWEKDKKISSGDIDDFYSMPDEDENKRDWDGTIALAEWYRKEFKDYPIPKIKPIENYNKENDIISVDFGKCKHSRQLMNVDIVLDFNEDDDIVGIEIFDFKKKIDATQKLMDKVFKDKKPKTLKLNKKESEMKGGLKK